MSKRCLNGKNDDDCDDNSNTLKKTRTYYDKLFEILDKTDKLELVSASSLTGFIFKITTNEVKPKSYIMKIVVLAPNDTDNRISLFHCIDTVPPLNNEKKITETEYDFRYEEKIQKYIYHNSIAGNRAPICPKVTHSVIFGKNISNDFLTLLLNTIENSHNSEAKSVIDCLLFYFNKKSTNDSFRLGIILMDEIPNCVTFYDFIHNNKNSEIDKNNKIMAYSYIYYQLIYLFLFIGKINFDMHMDNALVYSDNNTIKTTLIDFGRIDDLNDPNNNGYLLPYEKTYINTIREQLTSELFIIMFEDYGNIDPEYKNLDEKHLAIYQKQSKINFIMKTMNILNIICWAVNRRDYDYGIDRPTVHQMNWFKPIPEVIAYMKDISNRIDYDDDDNEYEYESIDEKNENMKNIIENLMKKTEYDINASANPEVSFDILEENTKTISTKNMNPKYAPIAEIGTTVIKNEPVCKNYDDDGDDDMCVIMGGRKTRKSKRKYKAISYSKSGKKSKIKPKRKTKRKSQRKSERKS